MLTDQETRREHDEGNLPREGASPREHEAQMRFPALEEPTWREDDPDQEMQEPSDSPFRGMWIGIAAAALTFVLVFAVPQWLGWYDIGPPPQAKRDATPESVISTVTAKPSGAVGVETGAPAVPAAAAPPAAAPPVSLPKTAVTKETKRTFSVQIAAFKSARPAGQLAERVKRDGYPADVRRIESSAAPWVVRVGGYSSREQAESARDALARKGFRGFIL